MWIPVEIEKRANALESLSTLPSNMPKFPKSNQPRQGSRNRSSSSSFAPLLLLSNSSLRHSVSSIKHTPRKRQSPQEQKRKYSQLILNCGQSNPLHLPVTCTLCGMTYSQSAEKSEFPDQRLHAKLHSVLLYGVEAQSLCSSTTALAPMNSGITILSSSSSSSSPVSKILILAGEMALRSRHRQKVQSFGKSLIARAHAKSLPYVHPSFNTF